MTQAAAGADWTLVRAVFAVDFIGSGRERIGGPPQSLLELEQLAHEVQVRRDDGSALLDEGVGFDEAELRVAHQIRDGDGGRARDARVAVDQHGAAVRSRFLCENKEILKNELDE